MYSRYMYLFSVVILAVLATCYVVTEARNPGLRVRLSKSGLNYAANVALDVLSQEIQGKQLPSQNGRARTPIGGVNYGISGLRVVTFHKPSSTITLRPSQTLTWALSRATVKVKGNWRYKYKKGWIRISDHGSFDIAAKDISISVSVGLGFSNGRPTVKASSCSANVRDVDVKFRGGASWLYNLFRKYVERKLEDALEKMMCEQARKVIDVNAQRRLQTLKVQIPIEKELLLDYRLTRSPLFTVNYMQTDMKGAVLWKADPRDAPFQPATFPNFDKDNKMVRFWFSDYVMNTLGSVLHTHHKLTYNFTKDDLPEKNRRYLQTTCVESTPICFGSIFPKAAELCPNAWLGVHLRTSEAPKLTILPGKLNGHFKGELAFAVKGASCFKEVFTLSMEIMTDLNVSLVGGKIKATVPFIKIENVQVVNSVIGNIPASVFDIIFNNVLLGFLKKELNKIGAKGIDIPTVDDVTFVQPEIIFLQNAMFLATNVRYRP